ncbi:MAG: hypothetical protein R3D33_17900 [Hyphomicrobiaceae bacterium]
MGMQARSIRRDRAPAVLDFGRWCAIFVLTALITASASARPGEAAAWQVAGATGNASVARTIAFPAPGVDQWTAAMREEVQSGRASRHPAGSVKRTIAFRPGIEQREPRQSAARRASEARRIDVLPLLMLAVLFSGMLAMTFQLWTRFKKQHALVSDRRRRKNTRR